MTIATPAIGNIIMMMRLLPPRNSSLHATSKQFANCLSTIFIVFSPLPCPRSFADRALRREPRHFVWFERDMVGVAYLSVEVLEHLPEALGVPEMRERVVR